MSFCHDWGANAFFYGFGKPPEIVGIGYNPPPLRRRIFFVIRKREILRRGQLPRWKPDDARHIAMGNYRQYGRADRIIEEPVYVYRPPTLPGGSVIFSSRPKYRYNHSHDGKYNKSIPLMLGGRHGAFCLFPRVMPFVSDAMRKTSAIFFAATSRDFVRSVKRQARDMLIILATAEICPQAGNAHAR